MFESFMQARRQQFRDTFAEYARSKQDEDLKRIEIPNCRFYDKRFIENLFVSNGRIPVTIDTTTFRDRITVVTKDGEFWAGSIRLLEEVSVLELRLTGAEIAELETLE